MSVFFDANAGARKTTDFKECLTPNPLAILSFHTLKTKQSTDDSFSTPCY